MRLVRGDQLSDEVRRAVLASYVHRWTYDNPQRESAWRGINGPPTTPLISDNEWLAAHAFYVTGHGTLSVSRPYCEPAYLIGSLDDA